MRQFVNKWITSIVIFFPEKNEMTVKYESLTVNLARKKNKLTQDESESYGTDINKWLDRKNCEHGIIDVHC